MLEVLIHRRRPGTICLLHVLYLRPTTWKRDTWHRPLAQATGPSAGRPGRSASGPHRCRAAHSQRDHARRPHAVPRILTRPAQPALLGRSIRARAPDSLTTLLCSLLYEEKERSKEQRSVVSAGTLDERLRGCWFCPVLVAVPPRSISFDGSSGAMEGAVERSPNHHRAPPRSRRMRLAGRVDRRTHRRHRPLTRTIFMTGSGAALASGGAAGWRP